MRRLSVVTLGALGILLPTACSGDEAAESSATTAAISGADGLADPPTEAALGSALEALGLGCEDVGEVLPDVIGAECTVHGSRVVLQVFEDDASQQEYLRGKLEILCPMFLTMGETEAAIVVGDGWTARPDSPAIARRIAKAAGADLRSKHCRDD